jgi:hypothetical protein
VGLLYGGTHVTGGMPARCEELRTIRWANTPTSLRNVFVHNGKLILIFTYNKAITHHNNSFYVVRTPCPAIQRLLFIFLAFIRPFRDYLARQLKVTSFDRSNCHLFALHKDATACFSPARCLTSLRLSTGDAPFQLNTATYRQIAVSIAKKHLPRLIQAFDPHVPQDQSGILRLLAFQTGHRPQTQAHSYALEKEYPSRLQPELINRYDQNSSLWHEFNLIRAEDVIDVEVDNDQQSIPPVLDWPRTSQPGGYEQSTHREGGDLSESEISDAENGRAIILTPMHTSLPHDPQWPDSALARGGARERQTKDHSYLKRGTKRVREASPESPTSKKIRCMQGQLERMLQERQVRKR